MLFLRLPRKSEIATSWREVKGGKSERSQARRGEEGKGRQETDDQAHLLAPSPFPPAPCLAALFTFLSSPLLPASFPLLYFEGLDWFPV